MTYSRKRWAISSNIICLTLHRYLAVKETFKNVLNCIQALPKSSCQRTWQCWHKVLLVEHDIRNLHSLGENGAYWSLMINGLLNDCNKALSNGGHTCYELALHLLHGGMSVLGMPLEYSCSMPKSINVSHPCQLHVQYQCGHVNLCQHPCQFMRDLQSHIHPNLGVIFKVNVAGFLTKSIRLQT